MEIIHHYQHHKKYRIGPYSWSDIELGDLAKAWIALSVAFAIVLSGVQFSAQLFIMIGVSALTVGVGFIFHEMGHKIVAQRYGVWAEFRANYPMLLLAVAMSFLGFVFAAPGAVIIGHNVNKNQNGKISIAGPMMNIILSIFFMILGFFMQNIIITYGFLINAWLALFNMIPFGFFDGYKIWKWNKAAYLVTVLVAALLVFLPSVNLG
ncbi:MAG: metalloprotease [Nanoarchaeota archaeon]|nr:metalloprotease [Nanoarchaeota archaeon]